MVEPDVTLQLLHSVHLKNGEFEYVLFLLFYFCPTYLAMKLHFLYGVVQDIYTLFGLHIIGFIK